ncbi:MAG TPA: hypothetical protein VN207_01870 [Ktedonobacteraceae bacterium]|nr:hypothetical protein [Ktedonobacteraceae bacterium]
MKKQESPRPHLQGNVGGNMMREDRYYVQRLTEQVFLVRERLSPSGGPDPNDRHVRSFDNHRDAYLYASSVNEIQRKLDEQYGHWAQHAIGER